MNHLTLANSLADQPLEWKMDLALWSVATFLVFVSALIAIGLLGYRHKLHSMLLLSVGIIIGMLYWPLLAIVSAILLAAVMISNSIRRSQIQQVESFDKPHSSETNSAS